MKTIKKGDQVWIKKAWQDDGDDQFTWIATEDESLGRVGVMPQGTGLAIPPWQVVPVHMLDREAPAPKTVWAPLNRKRPGILQGELFSL